MGVSPKWDEAVELVVEALVVSRYRISLPPPTPKIDMWECNNYGDDGGQVGEEIKEGEQ